MDYLGSFASLRLTSDARANSAILSGRRCTLHTQADVTVSADPVIVEDARNLVQSARSLASSLDEARAWPIWEAASRLEGLLDSSPTTADLITAIDRKSTRLNSSHPTTSRMPSSA